MPRPKYPVTPAIRALRAAGVTYESYLYDYVEHGGTRRAAAELGVDEHAVVKTLVMQADDGSPVLLLMHGDREVAVGLLARALGVRSIRPCDPGTAQEHTGYLVGGTSPFGLRTPLPVCVERSIFHLPRIFINGGKRGYLVALAPDALRSLPDCREVDVAAPLPER